MRLLPSSLARCLSAGVVVSLVLQALLAVLLVSRLDPFSAATRRSSRDELRDVDRCASRSCLSLSAPSSAWSSPSASEEAWLSHLVHSSLSSLAQPLPHVSVIIPCFNFEAVLFDAVASLLRQSYPASLLEILVVDDGSTDAETLAALDELLQAYTRERWPLSFRVLHKTNGGLASARNHGARHASHRYLLFLDHDDVLEPHAISLMMLKLLAHPRASYVYPDQWFFGLHNHVWNTQPYNAYDLLWANHPTVCVLIRREAFEQVPRGYDSRMGKGMEDWLMWLSLSSLGLEAVRLPLPLFQYRTHANSMSKSVTQRDASEIRQSLVQLLRPSMLYEPHRIHQRKQQWRPLISIVLAILECDDHTLLLQTLESLQRQSSLDLHVVLVLAASCDSSSSSSSSWLGLIDRHCHNLARPFPCTFASIHDNSQSQQQQQQQQYRSSAEAADEDSLEQRLSQARNVGLYHSRGDYLLFLNAGERLSSSAIEKLSLLAVSAQPAWITFGWTVVDTENLAAAPAAASSASSFAAIDREMLESRDLPPTMLVARSVLLELGAFDSDFDGNSMHDLMVRMLGLDLTHLRGIMLPEVLLELPPPPPSPSREPQLHLKRKPTVADMRLLLARNPRSASLALTVPTYVPNYRRLLDTREQERGLMELVLERPFSDYYRRLLTPSLQFQSGRRLNAPVPFDPVAWNATAPATIMYLIPNMLEVGGAELIDWHIVSHLLSSAVDPPMRVVLVVESLLRKRIEPSATSLHRWHARYERLLGAENLLYLDHVIDPELACAEHLRLQVLEHLVTSRAVQLLFNRNTYIGYSLAKRWRTLKLFPSVALADLIHLYEPLEGAWERYSAPYHSHLDARFVISNDLRDHMITKYKLQTTGTGAPPFHVVHNGVDFEQLAALSKTLPESELHELLHLNASSTPIVGFVARLDAQKNPLKWLEVAARVAASNRAVHFVMIGTGPLRRELEAKIEQLPFKERLHYLGYKVEPARLMRSFSVLLLTSSHEGLPMVMLEALALGVAVVSSDVGAVRECQPKEELHNLLPATADSALYAQRVLNVLALPHDVQVHLAATRQSFASKFSLARMKAQYAKHIRSLLKFDKSTALYQYIEQLMSQPAFGTNPQCPTPPLFNNER